MPPGPLIVVRIVPSFFHLAPRLSINGGGNYCDTGGNVVTSTFCAMRSIICRARPMTTACRNGAGCMTGGISPKPRAIRGLAHPLADEVPRAHQLGRSPHRQDADLLPPAPGAPQASEERQHAKAAKRGDQTPHTGGADLPEHRVLPAPGPGAVRRDP